MLPPIKLASRCRVLVVQPHPPQGQWVKHCVRYRQWRSPRCWHPGHTPVCRIDKTPSRHMTGLCAPLGPHKPGRYRGTLGHYTLPSVFGCVLYSNDTMKNTCRTYYRCASIGHVGRWPYLRSSSSEKPVAVILKRVRGYQRPHLLTWFNFNPSMDK